MEDDTFVKKIAFFHSICGKVASISHWGIYFQTDVIFSNVFLVAEFPWVNIFFMKSVLVFLLHVSSLKYGLEQVLTHLKSIRFTIHELWISKQTELMNLHEFIDLH